MKLSLEQTETKQTRDSVSLTRKQRTRYIPAEEDYIDWSMISSDDV